MPEDEPSSERESKLPTLEMLSLYARGVSTEICERMSPDLHCSVMMANNWVLTAAIVECGGELIISADAVHRMLTNHKHIAALTNDDGSIKLTLQEKAEVLGQKDVVAL